MSLNTVESPIYMYIYIYAYKYEYKYTYTHILIRWLQNQYSLLFVQVVAAMLETSETWAVLEGLRPFTRYTVEVFAKPLVEGFWSEGKTDRFQTLEDGV